MFTPQALHEIEAAAARANRSALAAWRAGIGAELPALDAEARAHAAALLLKLEHLERGELAEHGGADPGYLAPELLLPH